MNMRENITIEFRSLSTGMLIPNMLKVTPKWLKSQNCMKVHENCLKLHEEVCEIV